MDGDLLKAELLRLVSPSSEVLKQAKSKYERLPVGVVDGFVVQELSFLLLEFLQTDPNLKDRMIRHGNGASNFCLSAGRRLIELAMRDEVDAGVAWFERVCSLKSSAVLEILPLWGVDVGASHRLVDQVDLVPFGALPDSSQKAVLLSPGYSAQSHRPSYAWTPPSAALVAKWSVAPLFYQGDVEPDFLQAGDPSLLQQARLCLSIVAPSCVVPAISWFQYDDVDLNFSILGGGYSIPFLEIQPSRIRSFGNFSSEEAAEIVSQYFAFRSSNERLHLALDRFDRAMRRHNPGDAAVELAIALEALVGDGKGELIWKIGLRSALLLGGSREEKIEARKIVHGIYELRSATVHSGTAPMHIKVKGIGKIPSSELVEKGAVVSAKVIKAAIRKGVFPNWFETEVGD